MQREGQELRASGPELLLWAVAVGDPVWHTGWKAAFLTNYGVLTEHRAPVCHPEQRH